MNTAFRLEEAVREARRRTRVPGVAAGLAVRGETAFAADGVLMLGAGEPVRAETPFRIASISKPFTATLAAECLELDADVRARLSHTAGLRCESPAPLPPGAQGLWSYSNAGYWDVGAACASAHGTSFEEAMRALVLEPLGLAATSFEEPPGAARGHVQQGETGHRAVPESAYPAWRRPSGGLWSTVGDLLRFGAHHLSGAREALHRPQGSALGGEYALGWWVRSLADGRTALDHEGSVAGYQSLLLLVPEDALVLAVLTNSWRGSGLIRRVAEALGLSPAAPAAAAAPHGIEGRYALDDAEAAVARSGSGLTVTERGVDPVTGAPASTSYPARPLGGGVYAFARGVLMSHRLDFPRPGLARIGWVVLPRAEP